MNSKSEARKSLIKWLYLIHVKYKELYVIKRSNYFSFFIKNNKTTTENIKDNHFFTLFFINLYKDFRECVIYNNRMIIESLKNKRLLFSLFYDKESNVERADNELFKELIKTLKRNQEIERFDWLIQAFNIIYNNKL